MTDELLSNHGMRTDRRVYRARDRPAHFRNVLGNPTVDIPLEPLDEFGAPLVPPQLRRGYFVSVVRGERIGNGSFDTIANSISSMLDFQQNISNDLFLLDPNTGEPINTGR